MYKKSAAIAIAGKTSPTRGTKIEGRYKFSISNSLINRSIINKTDSNERSSDSEPKTQTMDYSKSFDFGFRPGSFERKPKINRLTKKITTVYTRIFKVNMDGVLNSFFSYYTSKILQK